MDRGPPLVMQQAALPDQTQSRELRLVGVQVGCVLGKAGENITQIRKVTTLTSFPIAWLIGIPTQSLTEDHGDSPGLLTPPSMPASWDTHPLTTIPLVLLLKFGVSL